VGDGSAGGRGAALDGVDVATGVMDGRTTMTGSGSRLSFPGDAGMKASRPNVTRMPRRRPIPIAVGIHTSHCRMSGRKSSVNGRCVFILRRSVLTAA
jgi:hypothetical protein